MWGLPSAPSVCLQGWASFWLLASEPTAGAIQRNTKQPGPGFLGKPSKAWADYAEACSQQVPTVKDTGWRGAWVESQDASPRLSLPSQG